MNGGAKAKNLLRKQTAMRKKKEEGGAQSNSQPRLLIKREEAEEWLRNRVAIGNGIVLINMNQEQYEAANKEYVKWDNYNADLLRKIFDKDSLAEEYSAWGVIISTLSPGLRDKIEKLWGDVDKKLNRLESIIERLELFEEAVGEGQAGKGGLLRERIPSLLFMGMMRLPGKRPQGI